MVVRGPQVPVLLTHEEETQGHRELDGWMNP